MDGRGPYGLACQNCAKGKVKCIAMPEGDGCQRCHRLKKPCHPSHGVRKRESQHFQSPLIEEMDAKLDSVLSLLQSVYLQPPSPNGQSQQYKRKASTPELSSPTQPARTSVSESTYILPPGPLASPDIVDAEGALNTFREEILRFCPFLYLPPGLTARQLQQERPFLFETILSVMTRSVQEKMNWSKRIKSTIAHSMVMENESNIDLLLGLLVYACWSQDHYLKRMPTLTRIVELAVSVVMDLNLNKPPPPDAHRLTELGGGHDPNWTRKGPKVRTAEEKRAVLGCFLLSSIISSYFYQMDAMRWTPQMEEDLGSLAASPEWPGDAALAVHVRLQLLAENARKLRDEHGTKPVHIPFFLKSFRFELEAIRNSIPSDLQKDDIILSQLHYVELSIHETAFTANIIPHSINTNNPIGPDAVDCMWHSLLAIKSWDTIYRRMPPGDHMRWSITQWIQLSRAVVTLYRLSTHPAPDWNRDAVYKTLNIVDVFTHIRASFDQLVPNPGGPFPNDFWAHGWLLGRAITTWLHAPGRLHPPNADEQAAWAQASGSHNGEQVLSTWNPPGAALQPQPLQESLQFTNPAWIDGLGLPPEDPTGGMHQAAGLHPTGQMHF
ncbi:hypothetical protein BDW60DRAFT_176873 [Aspergillus nidulans var. acristatus]